MGPIRRQQLRATLLGSIALVDCASAQAQNHQDSPPSAAVSLETIDVNPTSSRLSTSVPRPPAREREQRVTPAPTTTATPTAPTTGAVVVEEPSGIVTKSTITG